MIAVERDDPKRPAARPLGPSPIPSGSPPSPGVVPLSGEEEEEAPPPVGSDSMNEAARRGTL